MGTRAGKLQKDKVRVATNVASRGEGSNKTAALFVDNRREPAASSSVQMKTEGRPRARQEMVLQQKADVGSSSPPVAAQGVEKMGGTVQMMPINKPFVKAELGRDEKGREALEILDTLKVYEYQRLDFMGAPKISHATTLPHASPPIIYVNEKKNDSDETATLTLFHEAHHAYDPATPALDDDSGGALKQDIANEVAVLRKEAKYAIEKGGKYLQSAVSFGSVVDLGGRYAVNEKWLSNILTDKQGYSNYKKVLRSDRFNPDNYVATGVRDLSGDWVDRVKLASPMGYSGAKDKSEFNPDYPGLEFAF